MVFQYLRNPEIFIRKGEIDRAEDAHRDAIRLDPGFAPASVTLADLYRTRDKESEGERVLRQGMAAAPKAAVAPEDCGAKRLLKDPEPDRGGNS